VFTCSYLNLDQRGFDMMAVTVSGYVDTEGAVDAPLMPLQVIFADYLAGRRSASGGRLENIFSF
jgi:crotonobetainyl-CoA:carnitine CoA-transferase CaiB-like acyl-CoA transferase